MNKVGYASYFCLNTVSSMPSLRDRFLSLIQYPLPHHLLSKLMYWATRCRAKPVKNAIIRFVIKKFDIDMSIAASQDLDSYCHFNEFFTRPLKTDARPIVDADDAVACPVDGTVSQLGDIKNGRVFQAKGHDYSLKTLVGGLEQLEEHFKDGQFATIYLSPRDYHRIHMPLAGELTDAAYVPGRLFSVNPATTRTIPGLFARNERMVNVFETEHGRMAVILVGAIFVAGIETVWTGNFGDKTFRDFKHWDHANDAELDQPSFGKGEEMGRFNMGSTVVLLFEKDVMAWQEGLAAGQAVKMGEQIGRIFKP